MDKYARGYAWFLFAAAVLPGLMRLAMARPVATVTHERYQEPRRRTRYRRLGWGSAIVSLAMLPVYLYFRQHAWILIAAALGLLSGAEMVTNTSAGSAEPLVRQNVIYGALYLVTAGAAYLLLLHR